MISVDRSNLEVLPKKQGLSYKALKKEQRHIEPFLASFKKRRQGFVKVVDDQGTLRKVRAFAKKKEGVYEDIVVLGIGGSSLGAIAAQQALTHYYDRERAKREGPKLRVIDNIDPMMIRDVFEVINLKKTLFVVISKSGGTPETLAQYLVARKELEDAKLKVKDHMVFVTDPKKGLLRKVGTTDKITMFDIPKNVGGRFSVMSTVGLVPLALIGVDVKSLLAGAASMRDRMMSTAFEENLPFQLAAMQFHMAKAKRPMHVLWPYANKLRAFGDWYRQLLAESIGKAVNEKGKTVHVGITPIVALGATDQHSQSQLYNEGPDDKFFMFLEVDDMGEELLVPSLHEDKSLKYLNEVSLEILLKTERLGTATSLTENGRPNISINIEQLDEFTLGELFMLFMGATAFLGEYYKINAFNQPGVERSKVITKELLRASHA